jgi:hypothetical protein
LRARLLEFGDISLIRHQLLPSGGSEGLDVEGQHHALLPQEVMQPNLGAALVNQGEVRRGVADLRCGRS